MAKIKDAGYTPLICPGNPEGYQIAAVGNNLAEHELYKSGKLETPEYLTGRVSDLSAEFTTAASKLREWFDNGYIDAAAPGMTREEAQQSFLTQKGVIFFANNNEYSNYVSGAEEAGFELGFMAMPAPRRCADDRQQPRLRHMDAQRQKREQGHRDRVAEVPELRRVHAEVCR